MQQASFLYHIVLTQTIITPLVLLLSLHTNPQMFNSIISHHFKHAHILHIL